MSAELPPFKNWEHNYESTSTIDRLITPLIDFTRLRTPLSIATNMAVNHFTGYVLMVMSSLTVAANYLMSPDRCQE